MKLSSEMFQTLPNFWKIRKPKLFFSLFAFRATLDFLQWIIPGPWSMYSFNKHKPLISEEWTLRQSCNHLYPHLSLHTLVAFLGSADNKSFTSKRLRIP